ncbi:efflux RND transporter periplasmic adaptor subunit [Endozoicomonas arenosclerae]|uniref:efflux RND transporter periplasmic adaptor subunit n=1 Tax=Endozoicomonas arenosclerae TaxID=1633495 RepID=UPI000A76D495|nr:efflux RND transporter periplasmic adaptor subunit [Endozoicomonas arenosclerae]
MTLNRRLNKRLATLLLTGISALAMAEDKPPARVEVTSVEYQAHAQPIRTSGILSYKSQQSLSFKTAGPVQHLGVDEGDRVEAGQLLAKLTLGEINAQVDEAEARVEMARNNLNRFSQLHKSNVLSLEQLQTAETDLAVAESRLNISRFNLKYSSIKAPSKGLVLRTFVEENELVNAYQPVLMVADTDQGWVIQTGVTDEDIVRLQTGDKAQIEFDAWPGEVFEGKISQLATLADEQTGTFEIEITLPEKGNRLRSGFIGQVTLLPSRKKQVALLPVNAVVRMVQQQAEVFVYDPATRRVNLKTVTLDYLEPGLVASSSGLKAGDLLVTLGAGLLRDGEEVIPVSEPALLTAGE